MPNLRETMTMRTELPTLSNAPSRPSSPQTGAASIFSQSPSLDSSQQRDNRSAGQVVSFRNVFESTGRSAADVDSERSANALPKDNAAQQNSRSDESSSKSPEKRAESSEERPKQDNAGETGESGETDRKDEKSPGQRDDASRQEQAQDQPSEAQELRPERETPDQPHLQLNAETTTSKSDSDSDSSEQADESTSDAPAVKPNSQQADGELPAEETDEEVPPSAEKDLPPPNADVPDEKIAIAAVAPDGSTAAKGGEEDSSANRSGRESARTDRATDQSISRPFVVDEEKPRREQVNRQTEPRHDRQGESRRAETVKPNATTQGEKSPDSQSKPPEPTTSHQQREATENETRVMPSRKGMRAADARVMQIETAVRLENAGGGAASTATSADSGRAVPVNTLAGGATLNAGAESGTSQTQQLPTRGAAIDEEQFSGRVLRGLTTMVNQRGGALTMRLDPPDLGQLRVQMTVMQGVVTASFQAESAQAQQLLERNLAVLRVALEGQGLTVERLTVTNSSSSTSWNGMSQQNEENGREQTRQDAGDGQSRGRRDSSPDERSGRNSRDDVFEDVIHALHRGEKREIHAAAIEE